MLLLPLLLLLLVLLLLAELSVVLWILMHMLVGLLHVDGVWIANRLNQHRLVDRLLMCHHVLRCGRDSEVLC